MPRTFGLERCFAMRPGTPRAAPPATAPTAPRAIFTPSEALEDDPLDDDPLDDDPLRDAACVPVERRAPLDFFAAGPVLRLARVPLEAAAVRVLALAAPELREEALEVLLAPLRAAVA